MSGTIKANIWDIALLALSTTLFLVAITIAVFSWSKKFKSKYIPMMVDKIVEKYHLKIRTNDKVNKNGEVPVYMRITIDKIRAEYATGERIGPSICNSND